MGSVTTRLKLRYPLLSDPADVPTDITNLANDIDIAVIYNQGAQSARPPSASGTPGIAGRMFYNTDTGISTGDLQFDFGQGYRKVTMYKTDGNLDLTAAAQLQWSLDTILHRMAPGVLQTDGLFKALQGVYVGELTTAQRDALPAGARPRGTIVFNTDSVRLEVNIGSDAVPNWSAIGSGGVVASGTLATRPAFNATNAPNMYYATDQDVTYLNTGAAWQRSGAQPGDLFFTMNDVANVGRVLLTGQAWPATTGLYADLYAKWSAKFPGNLPDMQGRMPVVKGTHADVNGIGKTEAGNLPANQRRFVHKHTVVSNAQTQVSGNGPPGGYGTPVLANATTTVGPQTGFEPTDGPAAFTVNVEAKL
jgi:hypothetical protein